MMTKKNTRICEVFPVPVRVAELLKNKTSEEFLEKIAENNKITNKNPTLVRRKIQMFSVLEVDGVCYHMRSGDMQCSVSIEWYPDKEIIQIIRDIFKYKKLVLAKEIKGDTETMKDIEFRHNSITRENNLKVYDAIIEQIKKPFYANYGAFLKKLREDNNYRDKFYKLKTYDQVEVLVQCLNYITANAQKANMTMLKGPKEEKTKFMMSNNISKYNITLISQSITGLFEKRIVLNKRV